MVFFAAFLAAGFLVAVDKDGIAIPQLKSRVGKMLDQNRWQIHCRAVDVVDVHAVGAFEGLDVLEATVRGAHGVEFFTC